MCRFGGRGWELYHHYRRCSLVRLGESLAGASGAAVLHSGSSPDCRALEEALRRVLGPLSCPLHVPPMLPSAIP
jgi:hypothetical protein